MSSHTEIYAESTVKGIHSDSDSEDSTGKDSQIDKKMEICELEKRDFDDEKGIEYKVYN